MMNNFSAIPLMKGTVEEVEISGLNLPTYTIHERGFEFIDELALSILQYGLLHPIIIRIKEAYLKSYLESVDILPVISEQSNRIYPINMIASLSL